MTQNNQISSLIEKRQSNLSRDHSEWLYITVSDTLIKQFLQDLQALDTKESEIDENTSDWYHTFKELYAHRIALYIRLVNDTPARWWIKSKVHSDWTSMEWWFIVMWYIHNEQISYHLPNDKWDLVECDELEKAYPRDWHTSDDVVRILEKKHLKKEIPDEDMVEVDEIYNKDWECKYCWCDWHCWD